MIGCAWECPGSGGDVEALLRPVIYNGELVEPLPDAHAARACAASRLRNLPPECRHLYSAGPYRVELSAALMELLAEARRKAAV